MHEAKIKQSLPQGSLLCTGPSGVEKAVQGLRDESKSFGLEGLGFEVLNLNPLALNPKP